MAASEAVPFVKTGGLADVIGSLPVALSHCGCEARIALPYYSTIDLTHHEVERAGEIDVHFDGELHQVAIHRAVPLPTYLDPSFARRAERSVAYLIEAPRYFDRSQLYGYDDDILRFGFFSRACVELLGFLSTAEGWSPDIVHCHDWHTGLVPAYLVAAANGSASPAKSVFTIHNLAYQGLTPKHYMPRLGLDWSLFNYHQLEFHDQINPLKAGLVFANEITTVSPTYAKEIQSPDYGAGLHGVLQEHAHILDGIINGIDYSHWNPLDDCYLPAHFSKEDLAGKKACKLDLLKSVELTGDEDTPLLGIVSRLSTQKGFDLIASALESLVAAPPAGLGCRLIVLGAGDEYYMRLLERLARKFPRETAFHLGQRNEALAHKIYAGCDMFLMPSHYEPCGLSQMISLAYGTIPIVRATGGLADTVTEFDPETGRGHGFVFHDYNSLAMLEAVRRGVQCFHSESWPALMRQAMECDFSWDASAQKYLELYRRMLTMPG